MYVRTYVCIIEILSAILKSTRVRWMLEVAASPLNSVALNEKKTSGTRVEARRTVKRKIIAFWGTTCSPTFTMHKFMSEYLRV